MKEFEKTNIRETASKVWETMAPYVGKCQEFLIDKVIPFLKQKKALSYDKSFETKNRQWFLQPSGVKGIDIVVIDGSTYFYFVVVINIDKLNPDLYLMGNCYADEIDRKNVLMAGYAMWEYSDSSDEIRKEYFKRLIAALPKSGTRKSNKETYSKLFGLPHAMYYGGYNMEQENQKTKKLLLDNFKYGEVFNQLEYSTNRSFPHHELEWVLGEIENFEFYLK